MTDLDHYDYKLISDFDWVTFILLLAFPLAIMVPMLFVFISAYFHELIQIYELERVLFFAVIGYGPWAIAGYFFARGHPSHVKTVEQIELLPVYGQKKKVLK